ncbi:MAG: TetR/AcrR family transcriptional regulator [Chloroflexi bacterium]|nr:TetR/AcrR family transcriptional regulator [Chloroflexota bacterium]
MEYSDRFRAMDDNILFTTARPTRADAVKNRELLLDTARRLFDEQGVEAVSMSALAEAAGVGKGTLYRHFTSKSDLCEALLDADQRALQELTLQRLRSSGDALDTLRWFLLEVAGFAERNSPLLCTNSRNDPQPMLQLPAHRWWRQTIRGLLQQLALTSDIDYTADVLYVMLDANIMSFQHRALGYSYARIREGLLATLERLVA